VYHQVSANPRFPPVCLAWWIFWQRALDIQKLDCLQLSTRRLKMPQNLMVSIQCDRAVLSALTIREKERKSP
jgi:hypothetical protein